MITLLCGFPGSGKSYFLNSLIENFTDPSIICQKKLIQNAVVVCPDEYRRIITSKDFDPHLEDAVWFCVKNSARVSLLRYDIVVDATSLTKNSRRQWIQIAQEIQGNIRIVWFNTSFEICCCRNSSRERQVPEDVMLRMQQTFEPPTMEEGFCEVVVL